jgi:hypothetical protein
MVCATTSQQCAALLLFFTVYYCKKLPRVAIPRFGFTLPYAVPICLGSLIASFLFAPEAPLHWLTENFSYAK